MKITLKFDEKKKYPGEGIGIAIVLKYEPDASISCEHDEMWIGEYETTFNKMTNQEKDIMKKSGWSENEGSWHTYT